MARAQGHVTLRERPPYHPDTFKQPKVKQLLQYVLSREGWVIEIEGGKRGSKDVIGIYAWSQYLMITPEREHMVLGRTLDHAILTVLRSQGFGLYYCIPSGEFIRENISGGGVRGVFKFYDAYGIEKVIYFYGNEKREDYTKFKGLSLGSVYINEGNEQHINGIREAKDRTNASKWPLVILTQNPKSDSHIFYTHFEKPLIYDEDMNLVIRSIKGRIQDTFEVDKKSMLEDMEREKRTLVRGFLNARGVKSAELLPKKEQLLLTSRIRDLKETWNKKIRGLMVKEYIEDFEESHNELHKKIANASVQLICNYIERFENPNNVNNGLEFAYFHFTHDDNPAMSDADRARIDRTYDTSSPTFLRDIRGERATVDNAIWPTFDGKNIYYEHPDYSNMKRVLGVDLGYDHLFVTLDAFIDTSNTIWISEELIVDPLSAKEQANNVRYIEDIKNLIKSKNDGDYDYLRVDPSAKGFINQCMSSGLVAIKAKNRVRNYKANDTTESDHAEDRKIVGINLVREGFKLNKIMIHYECETTIKQVKGYAFDQKKLVLGVEAPEKINDDTCDVIRYIVNSEIGYVSQWEGGLADVETGKEEVLGEQVSKKELSPEASEREERYVKELINSFKKIDQSNGSRYLF